MEWRSSSDSDPTRVPRRRVARRLAAATAVVGLLVSLVVCTGCGRTAVRASEKEFLADQVMVFDHDSHEAVADEHVMSNREGAAGGRGTSGGGCGCN